MAEKKRSVRREMEIAFLWMPVVALAGLVLLSVMSNWLLYGLFATLPVCAFALGIWYFCRKCTIFPICAGIALFCWGAALAGALLEMEVCFFGALILLCVLHLLAFGEAGLDLRPGMLFRFLVIVDELIALGITWESAMFSSYKLAPEVPLWKAMLIGAALTWGTLLVGTVAALFIGVWLRKRHNHMIEEKKA